jgi:hypothetical protein
MLGINNQRRFLESYQRKERNRITKKNLDD